MRARCVNHGIGLIVGMCVAAPCLCAQEPKLELGTKVVAKSQNFVLSDGAKVIPAKSPFEIYRVEGTAGDRVRLYASGREGEAPVNDVVCLDQADAYFSAQIKAAPKAVHGYLMRCFVRCKSRDARQRPTRLHRGTSPRAQESLGSSDPGGIRACGRRF